MRQPLISVIIPVYNVENYLDDCLKSVSGQIYDNMEIIVVDDGSTDSSGMICDEWEKKDHRILVIHKENGGLSDARNIGLQAANGNFIAFVDSDDVIHPHMYQKLYEMIKDTGCEISCCRVKKDSIFENFSWNINNELQMRQYSDEEALRAIIKNEDISVTVWNKLYTRDVIKNIYFESEKIHEDEFWSYQVLAKAEKIMMTNQYYYGYRQRDKSIMNRQYSVQNLDLLDARAQRLEFLEKNYPKLISLARCDLRFECIRAMQFCLLLLEADDLKISKCRINAMVKSYPLKYRDYRILPFGRQVWCVLSNISFGATCHIRNRLHFGP